MPSRRDQEEFLEHGRFGEGNGNPKGAGSSPGRLAICRLVDGAGLVFLSLGLLLLSRVKASDPLAEIAFLYGGWGGVIFAALLFTVRPLLKLRWWRSWIGFIALGVLQLIAFFLIVDSATPILGIDSGELIIITELTGFAGILVGLVFLVAQWLVRRAERNS